MAKFWIVHRRPNNTYEKFGPYDTERHAEIRSKAVRKMLEREGLWDRRDSIVVVEGN